jgi:hypothetical protein
MPEVATMKETKMDRNISIAFLSKRLNETIRPNYDHIILLFIFYGQPGLIMPQRWDIIVWMGWWHMPGIFCTLMGKNCSVGGQESFFHSVDRLSSFETSN